MTIKLELSGIESVTDALESIEKGLARGLSPGTEKGLKLLENKMKQRVPVKTGRLKNSISSEITLSTKDRVEGEVGPSEPYAVDVEFGTSRLPAKPFVRPAIDNIDEAVDLILEEIFSGVEGV